ncbi:hypothetical protein BUALT_Bualt05G0132600 [Buddleja alternifolia]|uniref:Uncharacterized protein n=1 Tax=Buddleja alternifolia TaxID=168488 RepID=A0AAV6XUL3_9LAMI|nr:hypothetical protein BUALT_Bualt05G0132600 [Buddleja alternifolia]
MFPSTNSTDSPFESLFKRSSFLCDQNPSSKQDDHHLDPPFLFNFPSPFFDEHELPLNQILSQNHLMAAGNRYITDQPENNNNIGESKLNEKITDHQPINPHGTIAPLKRRNLGPIPRRRSGKKDRHSKICTAQGIRDRRMRLSLQVARKFFDLQDMLGYDKASKTIEWLFTKSKKAIKELIKDNPQANYNISISEAKSESFVSECEVVSGIEENSRNDVKDTIPPPNLTPLSVKDEVKSLKTASKPNMRESRDKARARARSRTREKMMIKRTDYPDQSYKPNPNDDDLEKLGFSSNSPFEGADQESNSKERVPPYESVYQPAEDVGTIEKLLGNSSSSSSWPIPDYQSSDSFLGFLGTWDMLNNDKINYAAANQDSLAGKDGGDVPQSQLVGTQIQSEVSHMGVAQILSQAQEMIHNNHSEVDIVRVL